MTAAVLDRAPGSSQARWRVGAMVAFALAIVAAALALMWPWSRAADMNLIASVIVLVGAFLVTGSMIALKEPNNALGWVLNLVAIFFALLTVTGGPGPSGAPSTTRVWISALFAGWWAPPIFTLLSVVPLIFPDGRLPSRRWRIVIWMGVAGSFFTVVSSPFDPEAVAPLENPVANEALYDGLGFGAPLGLIAIVLAMIGMVRRFRRARGVERDQLQLFVSAVVFAVFAMVLNGVLIGVLGEADTPPIIEAGLLVLSAASLCIGIGIAILRHKLFDINVVISKALVYGAFAVAVTGVYFVSIVVIGGLVVGTDDGNPVIPVAATAAAALAFQPLRTRAQRLANRLVYGKRATPYEVLSHLSEQLRETYASEDVLAHMARSIAEGTGASRSRVWMRTGDVLWTAASWPKELPTVETPADAPAFGDASLVVPVEHGGEQLGALSITKPPNDPLTTTEERLLTDLGAQAGLVLRNARLTSELLARLEELKASRVRLVKAQDEERRRLERDLHDGAQQLLVALKIKAGLVAKVATDPAVKDIAAELVRDTGDALENVRDLARGIYPPLLASDGLETALRSQAEKATVPVTVEADGVGRYPQEVEAAVYFCVLEALQNVQKYAGATRATVRLSAGNGELRFEVADDGRGFDPATARAGSGTQNMRDRLSALDGSVQVRSAPGSGTTVTGSIPARPTA